MAQGRQDALARLYDETSSVLNGLLLRILERPEDAEEVLLDVYMKAWKYAARYSDKRGSVQAWLMIMARNAAIDRIRQKRAQPKTLAFEPETTPEPESTEASPEEQTAERERRRKVQIVLRELPPEQREVVELAFFRRPHPRRAGGAFAGTLGHHQEPHPHGPDAPARPDRGARHMSIPKKDPSRAPWNSRRLPRWPLWILPRRPRPPTVPKQLVAEMREAAWLLAESLAPMAPAPVR